jgi:hypothetical protein
MVPWNDGAGGNVQLWAHGALTALPIAYAPGQNQLQTLRLSADASTIVYESDASGQSLDDQLIVYNISADLKTVLATRGPVVGFAGLCGSPIFQSPQFAPWISNDGQTTLYLSKSEVFVYAASGSIQLTSQPNQDLRLYVAGDDCRAFAPQTHTSDQTRHPCRRQQRWKFDIRSLKPKRNSKGLRV